ncbi:Histone-lysine N-methyltransferase SETMAR [Eumeta japonica]|uniref:Histone-lysine N-methyltransferase SETMAR n=1 Tax=Eumeta variegata TaxID=151549 RepID=A0A4C1SF98_EUMVA|nr:Histone-lysine N-methyltransferase SETMAR [Eumeta japonica]
MNRVLICDSLLKLNETEPFLERLATGDEKWIPYNKNVRKKSWSKGKQAPQTIAKPGLTRNKLTMSISSRRTRTLSLHYTPTPEIKDWKDIQVCLSSGAIETFHNKERDNVYSGWNVCLRRVELSADVH